MAQKKTLNRSSTDGKFVTEKYLKNHKATTIAAKKTVTEKQLLAAFDKYLGQIAANDKVSRTKFHHMQVAITGCKFLVNDLFGTKRKSVDAMVK